MQKQSTIVARGHGVELRRGNDGSVVLARTPSLGQIAWLAGAPLIGSFCTLAGIVADSLAAAAGLAILTLVLTAGAVWAFVAARMEQLAWSSSGRFVLRRLRGIRLQEQVVHLSEIAPDTDGTRVRVTADVSTAPGSHTITGQPGTLRVVLPTGEPPFPALHMPTRAADIDRLCTAVRAALPQ